MKKYCFVWIDDSQDKFRGYKAALESGPTDGSGKATVETILVGDKLLGELEDLVEKQRAKPPHLILIDHIFNVSRPFGIKGSSVAHLLRNAFPTVPMVCVTAMLDKKNAFDQEDLSEYTAVFAHSELGENLSNLFAIARDFPKLHKKSGDLREHIVSCLKAPVKEKEDLRRLLPEEFQTQRHATTEHRIARWILNGLMIRPGLLYDRLNAATLLGLTEQGFEKVENLFERALYKGVFATSTRPLWWSSELKRVLYDTVEESAPDILQLAGRTLPGVRESDFSVCYVSKKSTPPPDSVAFVDSTRARQCVLQRQFAEALPSDFGIVPGFEKYLVLKKGKR